MIHCEIKIPWIIFPNIAQIFIPQNRLQQSFAQGILEFYEGMLLKTMHTNPRSN